VAGAIDCLGTDGAVGVETGVAGAGAAAAGVAGLATAGADGVGADVVYELSSRRSLYNSVTTASCK